MKFSELSQELSDVIAQVFPKKAKALLHTEVTFNQSEYDAIFWRIFSVDAVKQRYTAKTSKKSAVALLHDFNAYIINNVRAHHAVELKLRNPIYVKRPKPPLRQHNLKLLPQLENCDRHLLALPATVHHQTKQSHTTITDLLDLQAHQPTISALKVYLGRLIYAAMRFGGLLRADLIKAFFHALLFGKPCCYQDIVWFELKGKAGETQLWLPDPISLLLINRFYQQREAITLLSQQGNPTFTEQQCLRRFLIKHAESEIASLPYKALRDLIVARLSISMTPCLLPVLTAEEPNLTLAPASFYRLLGLKQKMPEALELDVAIKPKRKVAAIPVFEPSTSAITDCVETIKIAKELLKKAGEAFTQTDVQNRKRHVGSKISGYSLKATKEELLALANDPHRNLLPITRELLRWCAHRLVNQSHWSQKLKPQSILTYLGSIVLPLTRFFGERRLENLDPVTIDEIYLEIIDDAQTLGGQNKRAKFLRDLDIFLVKEYGFSPSYIYTQTIVKSAREQAMMVDANILLPQEYLQAFQFFSGQTKYQAQLVVMMLGFRCGLRRSEAYMLRLCDIHTPESDTGTLVSAQTELLIRPYQQRGLKSASAVRRVPIGLLASAEELSTLCSYLAPRAKEMNSQAFLFVDSQDQKTLLDDGALFDPLVFVLQKITGDSAFRYHRLRHSFVTWVFWYWQQDKYTHMYPLKAQLQHPSLAHLTDAKRQYFDSDKAAPTRKVLHAISLMTGHSGPSITTLHYLHSMHWAAVAEFWRDSHLSREQESELLGVHRRSVFRHLQSGTIANLVTQQLEQYCEQKKSGEESSKTELPSENSLHQHVHGRAEQRFYNALYEYQNLPDRPEPKALAAQYQIDFEQLDAAIKALQTVETLKIVRSRKTAAVSETLVPEQTRENPARRSPAQLSCWPVHRSAAKTAQRTLAIFQTLPVNEQSKVLKAATELVWQYRAKISDIRFHAPARFQAFVQNLEPIYRQLLPAQKLKLMIRLSAPEDCEERQQFLEKWLLTDKKSEQFFILHCEYKFLGMRKYVSLNLSLIHNNEPGTAPARHADYGFKFALVALYYLYCRNNPHIQAFIDGKGREAAPMIKKPSASTQEYDYFGDKLTLSAEEWAVLSPVVQSLPTELDLYGSSAMAEPVTTSQAKKRRSKTPAIPPDAPPPQEAETIVSNYEDPEYAADLADHLSESKTTDKPTEPDNLS